MGTSNQTTFSYLCFIELCDTIIISTKNELLVNFLLCSLSKKTFFDPEIVLIHTELNKQSFHFQYFFFIRRLLQFTSYRESHIDVFYHW